MRLGRSYDRIVTRKVVPGCGSGRSDILRYYLPLTTLTIRVRKLGKRRRVIIIVPSTQYYHDFEYDVRFTRLQILKRDVSYVMF